MSGLFPVFTGQKPLQLSVIRSCDWCGKSIVSRNRQARFCSPRCRVYAHRNPIPLQLTSRDRWVRFRADKKPLTVDGLAASSTDPQTWAKYSAARASSAGVGLGFVLGDGIGCLDLDHCLVDGVPTAAAAAFLAKYLHHHIEVSPSGDGLHIWGLRDKLPGTKRTIDGVSVETYSTGRYITVTGNVFQRGALLPL